MKSTLIKHGTIITMDVDRRIIPDGGILFSGDEIMKVGPLSDFVSETPDTIIDATGKIIIPGLVNSHTHTAYYIMRGLGMNRMLLDWLQELVWPWLIEMDEEAAYVASMLGYMECLKSGTTCLVDNQNYPKYNYANYDAAATAALESGLRVNFACGYSDITFVCPEDFIDTPDGIEKELRRMINKWHGKGKVRVFVSPINLLYCSAQSIERGLGVMADTGTFMHTHVAESRQEYEALQSRFGKGYIGAFKSLDALDDRFQSVHSVWITPDEIPLLSDAQSHVIYNPTANMLLASGIAPIDALLKAGVNVALGTDNPNNNNDMFEAMKYAGLLQKVGTLDPLALPPASVLEMATINGAKALHLDEKIGSLEVGKQADIVIVDSRTLHNTPLHDPISTLVYSSKGSDVSDVFIGGSHLVKNKQIINTCEADLIYRAQSTADRLHQRVALRSRK